MKKDSTTAPNIMTTCFLALRLTSGLLNLIRILRSFDIKFLAMIPYKIIRINKGNKKNSDIVIKKNIVDHMFDASVTQTATIVPS